MQQIAGRSPTLTTGGECREPRALPVLHELVQVIRPGLHHFSAFRQMRRAEHVHSDRAQMRELVLDEIRPRDTGHRERSAGRSP